jgi:hypothetical protein
LAAAGDHYLDPRLDGWVKDGATWETARRILAEEVELAVHPDRHSAARTTTRQVLWRTFDDKTRDFRIERVRSRVTILPGPKPRLRAQILLDVWNADSKRTDVTLKLGRLPAGWEPDDGEPRTLPIGAERRFTIALAANGKTVPPSWNGKLSMPVILKTTRGKERTLDTAACFLTAGGATRPPKIDGVLRDWPMRRGNTASGFKLVGRRGRSGTGLAKRQTQAFVLNDEDNLYIAIRCREPDPAGAVARADNIIRYEQLMACEEDLVEIILGPGAGGEGPSDLYHIVVKSNGVLVAERGVKTDPPLGKTAPWAAGITVAVAKTKTDWIVELAVPLSAFGAQGRAALWGVNFARFATKGAESSSWSGAARCFYHPKNLGTMRLGRAKGR